MTVTALLSVAPVKEGSMAEDVAGVIDTIDEFDVVYETNPMGTVIQTETIDELLAVVAAAHKSVEGSRVSTFLKVDDKRTSEKPSKAKVEDVEAILGREARSDWK